MNVDYHCFYLNLLLLSHDHVEEKSITKIVAIFLYMPGYALYCVLKLASFPGLFTLQPV